jgi:hypothetical protein
MEILFLFVSIPTLSIGLAWFCIAAYARVRRKGYSPPAAAFVLLAGASASAICFYFALLKSALSQWPAALDFTLTFWLPTLIFVAATALIFLVLPRRNPRMSGKRRPRRLLIGIGLGLFGIGIFIVVWALWKGIDSRDPFKLMVILAGLGSALVRLGTRARSTVSIEEATSADTRAPVLYLRAFRQEHLGFISGPKSRYGQYVSKEVLALSTGDDTQDDNQNVEVRFEQYFREVLNGRIGPFVALGNPEDYVPPEGAARTYESDSDWMKHVEKLVTECSCIVAEIGISSNLAWELKYLLERGFQQKLFIMTRPAPFKSNNWLSRFIFWTMQIQVITWNDFASTMNAAGYEVGSEPGPGSVLTFDAAGKLVVLKEGAFTPEEFVAPIREFLLVNSGYSPESLDRAPPVVPNEPAASATKVVKPRGSWIKQAIYVVAFFAACAMVPEAYEKVKQHRERLRAEALQSFASLMRLRFEPGDLKIVDPDLSETWLIDHGNAKGRALYALEGKFDGLHALLFDYQYEVTHKDSEGDEETQKVVQSVAAFCCAKPRLPLFDLQGYSFLNVTGLNSIQSAKRIEFDGNPEFSKRFILLSGDKPSINRLFSTQLRGFLNDRYPKGNWRVEGTGPWLMLYQVDVRVVPEKWKGFLDETSQMARGFFQNMGKEPAPQTAAAK